LIVAIIVAVVRSRRKGRGEVDGFYPQVDLDRFWWLTAFLVVAGVAAGSAYTGANPFISFQF
jgi:hypothetical protein